MAGFPNIVRSLPEADAPFRDITLWLLRGPTASLIFVEASADSEVPEHSHEAQWGIVVAGELVLTIGGTTRTYRPGEGTRCPRACRIPPSCVPAYESSTSLTIPTAIGRRPAESLQELHLPAQRPFRAEAPETARSAR